MQNKPKEELIRQYEDAALALILNDYAEQEGDRLLQEFESAKAKGDVPAVPEELDQKCRSLIQQRCKKEETSARIRMLLSVVGKAVAIWCMIVGICAFLVVSVEALRSPVLHFIIKQYEDSTVIQVTNPPSDSPIHPTTNTAPPNSDDIPLANILGEEYHVVHYRPQEDGTFVIFYKTANDDTIILSRVLSRGTIRVDSENATTKEIQICGYNGYFIEQSDSLTLLWLDENAGFIYELYSTSGDYSTFWMIAEQYIKSN